MVVPVMVLVLIMAEEAGRDGARVERKSLLWQTTAAPTSTQTCMEVHRRGILCALNMLKRMHRRQNCTVPASCSFIGWFQRHRPSLRPHLYLRRKSRVLMAARIMVMSRSDLVLMAAMGFSTGGLAVSL